MFDHCQKSVFMPSLPSRWVCHDFPELKLAVENYVLNDFDPTRCVSVTLFLSPLPSLSLSLSLFIRPLPSVLSPLSPLLSLILAMINRAGFTASFHYAFPSFDSMKQLCERYNRAVDNIRKLVRNG